MEGWSSNATFQASPPILWHYWTPIVLKGHQNRTLAEFPTLQEFFLSAYKYDFCRSYIVLWLTYIQPQWYTVPLKPSSENKESLESLYSPRNGTTNYILTQAGLPLCCVVLKTLTPTSCVALVVQSVERLECHGFESHQGQLFLFLERVFLVQFAFPTSPCCCHITCISPTKGSSSFFLEIVFLVQFAFPTSLVVASHRFIAGDFSVSHTVEFHKYNLLHMDLYKTKSTNTFTMHFVGVFQTTMSINTAQVHVSPCGQ